MSALKDALLEIGSEELPASFIGVGMRQLKSLAEATLTASGLSFKSIEVFGTPRRLAVLIHGIGDRSPDQQKVVSGPPVAASKDAQGQWTAAAIGFAKKHGLNPSDLKVEKDKLTAGLEIKGVPARALLATLFPQWVAKLEFPKSMVWEPTHFRYPRPIRWFLALYGTDVVSFQLAGVRSGKWSFGLGVPPAKKVAVASAAKYVLTLKNQCVLVEPEARVEAVKKQVEHAVKRLHGQAILKDALLEQVANLVEHPSAVLGNFDPSYLELPREVLITCLEHHQRFFPVEAEKGGKLLPHFVGIRNGMSIHQETVRDGYERVLAARLADAKFFFSQDRRTPLSGKVENLQGVMFQKELGTLFDKKERIKTLMDGVIAISGLSLADAKLHWAADACKADLVTGMVSEFPELQGIMGRIYALADGQEAHVAQSLEQHYWPITLTSRLPQSDGAALLALADKLDTLAGDFSIGLIPSGSADPYGLRRAAVGVLRILEDRKWPISLEQLIRLAFDVQAEGIRAKAGEAPAKLRTFMRQRFAALLEERGYKADEIDAVLEAGLNEVPDLLTRLASLHEVRKRPEFETLSMAFKRAANIVRQASKDTAGTADGVKPDLFKEAAEQRLFDVLESVRQDVTTYSAAREYQKALAAMTPLREPLDAFFTGVLVMAEDPALRANRLALMRHLVGQFSRIADFSKLQNA